MKNFISRIIFIVYAIAAIMITILLLSFNSYNCSEINGYTFYIVKEDFADKYKEDDLLLIKQASVSSIKEGDEIFLYKVISSSEYEVIVKNVSEVSKSGSRTNIITDDGLLYDSIYLIGKTENAVVYHSLGKILSILESRWGYLFAVVIVTLLLLLQEIFDLILEIKYGNTNEIGAK